MNKCTKEKMTICWPFTKVRLPIISFTWCNNSKRQVSSPSLRWGNQNSGKFSDIPKVCSLCCRRLSTFFCSSDIPYFNCSPSHFPLHVHSEEENFWCVQSTLRVRGNDHKIHIWIRVSLWKFLVTLWNACYSQRPKTHRSRTVSCTVD